MASHGSSRKLCSFLALFRRFENIMNFFSCSAGNFDESMILIVLRDDNFVVNR